MYPASVLGQEVLKLENGHAKGVSSVLFTPSFGSSSDQLLITVGRDD
jgi:hypothetical protein